MHTHFFRKSPHPSRNCLDGLLPFQKLFLIFFLIKGLIQVKSIISQVLLISSFMENVFIHYFIYAFL